MFNYEEALSAKALGLKPSGIRKFFELLGDRKDVISLTVGQPDFDTPWHIRDAGIKSLTEGRTYYTANDGLLEFRQEISAYQQRRFGLEYDPKSEIIVTVGGSEAIDLACRCLIDNGDEVIVPEPSFVCYTPLVELAGGKAVIIPLKQENDFKLTAQELKAHITPRTKAIVLPFPNNPTGAIMEKDDLEALVQVIKDTNAVVISDEIYAELTFGAPHCSIASFEGMKERTIIIGGLSKSHAMTGWRLGYTLAPKYFTQQMHKIHQFGIMCAPTTSQYAAIAALRDCDSDVEYMKSQYDSRRKLILQGLREIGIKSYVPKGAFYVFPDISVFGLSTDEFCQRLLDEKAVAIVPGTAFGASGEGFARISYAYSIRHIEKALTLMGEFVSQLRP